MFFFRGFTQILVVDYINNFSPVINDINFCVVVIMRYIIKRVSDIIDVKGVFLHRNLCKNKKMKITQQNIESVGRKLSGVYVFLLIG